MKKHYCKPIFNTFTFSIPGIDILNTSDGYVENNGSFIDMLGEGFIIK